MGKVGRQGLKKELQFKSKGSLLENSCSEAAICPVRGFTKSHEAQPHPGGPSASLSDYFKSNPHLIPRNLSLE